MKKFLQASLILIILLSLSGGTFKIDTLREKHELLKENISDGKLENAVKTLEALEALDSRVYKYNNYDFLKAWTLSRLGRGAEAATIYTNLDSEDGIFEDYILHELARLRKKNNPERSISYLKRLISRHKNSLLYLDSIEMLAGIYKEQNDFSNARKYYDLLSRKSYAKRRESKYIQARMYEEEGKLKKAASLYYSLLRSRRSDTALNALLSLEELEKKTGKNYYTSLYSLRHRAKTAFANRSYDLSAKYFLKIYNSRAKKNPYKAEALYFLSRTYERSGMHDQAIVHYRKLIRSYRKSSWERRGLYQLARIQFIKGMDRDAVDTLNFLIKTHSRSRITSNAYFLLFQHYVANGDIEKSLKYSKIISKKYPHYSLTRKVLLQTAIIDFQLQKYDESLKIINKLLSYRRNSSSFKAELHFWKAKNYEESGRPSRAQDELLHIITEYPNDFFRYLAQDKLKIHYAGNKKPFFTQQIQDADKWIQQGKLNKAEETLSLVLSISPYPDTVKTAAEKLRYIMSRNKKKQEILNISAYRERPILRAPLKTGNTNRNLLKAKEFAFLGLYELAAEEFKKYRAKDYRDIEKLYTLATYYSRGKNPHKGLFWAESLVKLIGKDIDYNLLPEGVRNLLYPRDFEDIVENFSSERKVDKYFVLALIREESKFHASAKSPAAARGLMQFIPSTARDIAAELGLEDFELDDLYVPELNINLGTRYLANLMKEFQNNPLHVLSAYNSGERNTERWKKQCSSEEPAEFIARIDYNETRNYVKRVMASFRTYRNNYEPGQ